MADELRATGRVFDIQFSRGFRYEYTTTKLGYGFSDRAGGRHFRWIELKYGTAGVAYAYDEIAVLHPNDPEKDMRAIWPTKCEVQAILVLYWAAGADGWKPLKQSSLHIVAMFRVLGTARSAFGGG